MLVAVPVFIQWMLQNLCEFSTDYQASLRILQDPLKLREVGRIVQFPFALPALEEKTEEELVKVAERRKEQGRKLQELAAKTRMEKVCYICALIRIPAHTQVQLVQKENDLHYLLDLREGRGQEGRKEWMARRKLSWCFVYSQQCRTSYGKKDLMMMRDWMKP